MKLFAISLIAGVALTTTAVNQKPAYEALFDKFFAAETPADAEALADQLAQLDPDFVVKRLKQGRTYLDEKRGEY